MTGRLAKLHNFGSELQGTAQCARVICDPHFPVVNFRNITAVVKRARYWGSESWQRTSAAKLPGLATKGTTCRWESTCNAKTRPQAVSQKDQALKRETRISLLHFRMKIPVSSVSMPRFLGQALNAPIHWRWVLRALFLGRSMKPASQVTKQGMVHATPTAGPVHQARCD